MKRDCLVALASAVVVLCGVGSATAAEEQSASRTLSVEQTTIKDVTPPTILGDSDALEVVAWVDRPDSTYTRGEHVRMFVETNRDAYVTILNVDPAGQTTVLFPNEYQSANLLRANSGVEVPDPSSGSKVIVTGTVGTELIKVIASIEPVPLFDAMQLNKAGAFQMVRTEPRSTARSLVVAMTESSGSGPTAATLERQGTEWAMCHQTIATIPTLAPSVQRTRSLQVLRTAGDGGSVRCDEAER